VGGFIWSYLTGVGLDECLLPIVGRGRVDLILILVPHGEKRDGIGQKVRITAYVDGMGCAMLLSASTSPFRWGNEDVCAGRDGLPTRFAAYKYTRVYNKRNPWCWSVIERHDTRNRSQPA